jgi:hypothetical protein
LVDGEYHRQSGVGYYIYKSDCGAKHSGATKDLCAHECRPYCVHQCFDRHYYLGRLESRSKLDWVHLCFFAAGLGMWPAVGGFGFASGNLPRYLPGNNMSLDSGDPEAAVPEGRLHQAEGDGPRNRRSVFSRQRSPRATKAWLSIYEKGGAAPRLSMAAAPQTIRWQSLRREIEAELSPNCSLLAGGASDSLGDLNFDFAPGNESPTPNPQQHTCFAEESTPNDGKKKKEQLESLDEHESEDNESHEVVETSDTVFEA